MMPRTGRVRWTATCTAALLCLTLGRGAAAEQDVAAPEEERHITATVHSGETLSLIAQNHLGDASLWPAIYLANRDQIKEPSRIYPGQRLTIPPVAAGERQAVREQATGLLRR